MKLSKNVELGYPTSLIMAAADLQKDHKVGPEPSEKLRDLEKLFGCLIELNELDQLSKWLSTFSFARISAQ